MKIIAKVPKDTIPFRCGETLMACEVTDSLKFVKAVEFFKTKEEAKSFTMKHPEFKWNRAGGGNSEV